MLSDSTSDHCPSVASAHWRSAPGSSETIRSANRAAFTSSNSEWFHAGCTAGQVTATSQKTLMHVFAYTPLESATPEDLEEFKTATVGMVGRISGLRAVWVGKLREPLPGAGTRIHTHGVAMEFENTQALEVYANHPVHQQWIEVYDKVRLQGTTTLDILGE